MDNHSTDPNRQSPRPSAPLLPSSPENPAVQDIAPPSYSSVIAEDNRSLLQVINQQPRSILPLLPESGERPKEPDDIGDVITVQPTHANMGIADTEDMMKTDQSIADEDPKKRRRENTDRNTRNGADGIILYDSSCCCINYGPTPWHFSGSNTNSGEPNDHGCCSAGDGGNDANHDSCCFGCCDGSGDGCCDGGGGDGCCDGGSGDGCCDGGVVDSGGGDCGNCDCDCSGCFS